MDEVLREPDSPSEEHILDLEVKSLRDTRDILEKVGLNEAMTFIEDNHHPRKGKITFHKCIVVLKLTLLVGEEGGTFRLRDQIIMVSHHRLWRLLAEAAIEELDFTTAESAYVRCKDYPGIQFVKRLQNIQNQTIQKAEVAGWFSRYIL